MAHDVALKWSLDLQRREQSADGAGGFSEVWVTVGNLWADVQARGVSGTDAAGADLSTLRYLVIVRGAEHGSDQRPTVGQRFLNGANALVIDAVSERDPSGLYLQCWAHEEVLG